MRIDIITCQPGLVDGFLSQSIVKRAIDNKHVEINLHDIKEQGKGKYRQIDDYPFGGGAGMVLMIEPISNIIKILQAERKYDEVIYLTPDGTTLKQGIVNTL
jgi:tRNA (guanine37-N1)-methyltransferase